MFRTIYVNQLKSKTANADVSKNVTISETTNRSRP